MQKKTCSECGCYHKNYMKSAVCAGVLNEMCAPCESIFIAANKALFEIKRLARSKGRSLLVRFTIRKIIKKSK
jgi:hypothetical protein